MALTVLRHHCHWQELDRELFGQQPFSRKEISTQLTRCPPSTGIQYIVLYAWVESINLSMHVHPYCWVVVTSTSVHNFISTTVYYNNNIHLGLVAFHQYSPCYPVKWLKLPAWQPYQKTGNFLIALLQLNWTIYFIVRKNPAVVRWHHSLPNKYAIIGDHRVIPKRVNCDVHIKPIQGI